MGIEECSKNVSQIGYIGSSSFCGKILARTNGSLWERSLVALDFEGLQELCLISLETIPVFRSSAGDISLRVGFSVHI